MNLEEETKLRAMQGKIEDNSVDEYLDTITYRNDKNVRVKLEVNEYTGKTPEQYMASGGLNPWNPLTSHITERGRIVSANPALAKYLQDIVTAKTWNRDYNEPPKKGY